MKKITLLIVSLLLISLPLNVKAINLEEYNTLNFEQALLEEEIEKSFDKLEENDKQVTIYLFRGRGCSHCRDFLTYLNKIYPEEGKKFKVVSFESWYDSENKALLADVADFLGITQYGVPLILIGEEQFSGFAEDRNASSVLKAINDTYEQDPADRYDIFEAMETEEPDTGVGAGGVAIIVFCAAAVIIIYDTIRFNKLQDRIDEIASKKK